MSEKKSKTRSYALKNRESGHERIVVATSKAQALSHVANSDWEIGILSVSDAIRLTKEGVAEERAGDPDQPEQVDAFDMGVSAGGTD